MNPKRFITIIASTIAFLFLAWSLIYAGYQNGYTQAQHDFIGTEMYQSSPALLDYPPKHSPWLGSYPRPEVETDFAIDRVWILEEDVTLCTTPEIAEAEKLADFSQPGNFFETVQGNGCYMLRVSPHYPFAQVLEFLYSLEKKYAK